MDKNKNKNQSEKKKEHSFYKEANKSFLKNSDWTPKRVGSISLKITKWFLFGFLIISTLWGCVNEFIVQTSHNMGQGIEFYEKKDFVYPNMYQGVNITGYTASEKNILDYKQFTNDENEVKKSPTPFNFLTVNPFYGAQSSEYQNFSETDGITFDEAMQVNDLLVNSSHIPTLGTRKNGKNYSTYASFTNSMYAYNPNILTFSSEINKNGNDISYANKLNDGLYLSASNFPPSFKTYKKDGTDEINSWAKYAFKKAEDGKLKENEKNINFDSDFFIFKSESVDKTMENVVGINGTIAPTNSNEPEGDWAAIRTLDTTTVVGEVESLVNVYAFNSGKGKASYSDLASMSVKFDNNNILFSDAVKIIAENNDNEDISSLDTYSIDYTLAGKGINNIYGGAQTLVVPIAKGFPLIPSQKAIDLINKFRKENINYASSDKGDYVSGFDPTIQNYGWTILDENGDLISLYDDELSAISKTNTDNESNYLYANQRTNGYGTINDLTDNNNIFDEKVKTLMKNKFVNMNLSIDKSDFFGHDLSLDYASSFAGIISREQAINTDNTFTGVMPTYTSNSIDNDSGKYEQNSILASSVASAGQDGTNYHRVIFQGWSDWDKAWGVQYGPLYGAFVFPLAQLSMSIGDLFNYHGNPWGTLFSIFVIVFILRGIGSLLSIKGTNNQMKMQEMQTEVAKIKSKYSKYDLKENKQMKQKQQMEIMALYRKNNINPMGSLGTIFITMPIFLSLWIIISSLPAYKAAYMGQFAFSVSSFYGMFNLGAMFFLYLLVGLTVGLVQGVSSKLPTWLGNKRKGIKRLDEGTKKAMKKQNKMQNIMVGVFIVMGLTVPVLLAFYWITSGLFTITLELIRHFHKLIMAKKMKKNN